MSRTNLALGALLVFFLAFLTAKDGSFLYAPLSLFFLFGLTLTTLPFMQRLFGRSPETILFSLPVGFLIHSALLSVLIRFAGNSVVLFYCYVGASLLLSFVVWLYFNRSKSISDLQHEWNNEDYRILLIWMLSITAVLSLPFLHLGQLTAHGYAYRAYFNTDFFRNLAVAFSINNGGIPPENPYFAQSTLHYYWFFHVLPSYWIRIFSEWRSDLQMVHFSMFSNLCFAGVLFCILKRLVSSRAVLYAGILLLLLAGSYEGIYAWDFLRSSGKPLASFTLLNIDGILRWHWRAPQVDTLYRAMLYGPQHIMAISIALIVFTLWHRMNGTVSRLFLYLLAFLSAGLSVIIGTSLVIAAAILSLNDLVRNFRGRWKDSVAGIVIGLIVLASYFYLFSMFVPDPSSLRFELSPEISSHFPAYFILNWGALLSLGIAGIWFHRSHPAFSKFLLHLSICLVLLVSVHFKANVGSDISLKLGYVMNTILLIFAAVFVDRMWRKFATKRLWIITGLVILLIPSTATFIMDSYNCQDIKNARFTTYIPKDHWKVFQWIRENTSTQDIIQNPALYYGKSLIGNITEIPAITGRPVYVGDPILSGLFQVNSGDVQSRRKVVSSLYEISSRPAHLSSIAQSISINFLVVDEKVKNKPFRDCLSEPYFTLVASAGNMKLYRTNKIHTTGEILDQEERILLKTNNGDPILTAFYDRGFYPFEKVSAIQIVHWMASSGLIILTASEDLIGSLRIEAQSLGKNRRMHISLSGESVMNISVNKQEASYSMPVSLRAGNNLLMLESLDGADPANTFFPGLDDRSLSIRILDLGFKTKQDISEVSSKVPLAKSTTNLFTSIN